MKIKIKKDSNCDLLYYENLKKKLKIKRIFFLKGKRDCIRGNHAHKKCSQYFLSIQGSIKISTNNGEKKIIKVRQLDKVLHVPPYTWVKVFLKKNQLLCVMCDRNYEKNDYINSYDKFIKIIT